MNGMIGTNTNQQVQTPQIGASAAVSSTELIPPKCDAKTGALLEQAASASRLWSILREPESRLIYLSAKQLGQHLKELVFGGEPSAEQKNLHVKTLEAIRQIADGLDSLKYYATVMPHWPIKRFEKVLPDDVANALSEAPIISLTPISVELQLSQEDWRRGNEYRKTTSIGFAMMSLQSFPDLSDRVICYGEEVRRQTLLHERAHVLEVYFVAPPECVTVKSFRMDLYGALLKIDLAFIENQVDLAIANFEYLARSEIVAHYLSGDRAENLNKYLSLLPRDFLRELYEFLWMADCPISQKESLYSSAAARFQNSKQAVQEFHWLADQLFFPRDRVSSPISQAPGILLITSIDERYRLCPLLEISPKKVPFLMQQESVTEIVYEPGSDEAKTFGINPYGAFPSNRVAFAYAFPRKKKMEFDEWQKRLSKFARSLRLAPDKINKGVAMSLNGTFTKFAKREQNPEGVDFTAIKAVVADVQAELTAHCTEHFPSFRSDPPIIKQVRDFLEIGSLDALRAAVEIIPDRDPRYWDRFVIKPSAFDCLREAKEVDFICTLFDKVGSQYSLRALLDVVDTLHSDALTEASVTKLRTAMRAATDAVAPHDTTLRLEKWLSSGFLGFRRTVLNPTFNFFRNLGEANFRPI